MMPLVAYLLLFVAVGVAFIFVHLVAGKLIRPSKPAAEKETIYECGEPTIGSAWIQFDLRFYVVALLFVIFDVEVAFFFPWAEVFGKANAIVAIETAPTSPQDLKSYGERIAALIPPTPANNQIISRYNNLHELQPGEFEENRTAAHGLAWLALGDILVFFGVLLVGFAYLWKRGDLEWVRSLADRASKPTEMTTLLSTSRNGATATTTNGAAAVSTPVVSIGHGS